MSIGIFRKPNSTFRSDALAFFPSYRWEGGHGHGTNLAESRLSVLELAKEVGNVAAAVSAGLNRTSFYEWKRRFQAQGFEGLKDLPPIHESHPQTTTPETVERLKALALEHPAYGCNRHETLQGLAMHRNPL